MQLATALMIGTLLTVGITPQSKGPVVDERLAHSAFALRVVTEGVEVHGTAMLIWRCAVCADTQLYFLTSARLFRGPDGTQWPPTTIQLSLDDRRTLDLRPDDIVLAGDAVAGVAMLRVTVPDARGLRSMPLLYESPSVGTMFLIFGTDEFGAAKTVVQHVRDESASLVVGDRDVSDLAGCLGAPAMAANGVFGVVQECEPHQPPVIALLSVARATLERDGAQALAESRPAPHFDMVERQLTHQLSLAGCDLVQTREIEVPLQLGPHEFVTAATATLVTPHEIHLTDLKVLKVNDRSVRLQLTIGGPTMLGAPSASCQPGQALITLHLRLAVIRLP